MKITYSIVVPIYNEKENIPELYRRVSDVMNSTRKRWELVLVDDGSTDGSTDMIRELAKQDKHVRPVIFARNFGHQIAITAGWDYARGDAVVIIDADLQDPPELILEMAEKWQEGYEVVYAIRAEREGESWFKLWTASLFYRIIYRITDVEIPLDTGDFRLMDRKVVDVLKSMRERHRFPRGMSAWVGFKQIGVEYKRAARVAGETKYPFKKMLKFALDGMLSFSQLPLKLASAFGFICAILSFVFFIYGFTIRIFFPELVIPGWTSIFVASLFVGGVQLMCVGILGEYVGRIYEELKGRPLYIIEEERNF